jgi:phosphoribosyl-AMP cyclohydrolase
MSSSEFHQRLPASPSLRGFLDALKYDAAGLVTVVVQDAGSCEVLMVAHADREALARTLRTGRMHYYSRSRRKIWIKGEESGHTQRLVSLAVDCDGDALLARVRQKGGACHQGYRSCFSRRVSKGGRVSVVGRKVFDPRVAYGKG